MSHSDNFALWYKYERIQLWLIVLKYLFLELDGIGIATDKSTGGGEIGGMSLKNFCC